MVWIVKKGDEKKKMEKINKILFVAIEIVAAAIGAATLVMQESDTSNALQEEVIGSVVMEETLVSTPTLKTMEVEIIVLPSITDEPETDINLALSMLSIVNYKQYWDYFGNDTGNLADRKLVYEMKLKNIGDEAVICHPAIRYEYEGCEETGYENYYEYSWYSDNHILWPGLPEGTTITIHSSHITWEEDGERIVKVTGGIMSADDRFYGMGVIG